MKNLIIKYSGILFVAVVLLSGCKKDYPNIYNEFKDVTVTLHNSSPYAITKDTTYVQPGDSVIIDYTIKSPNKGIYSVYVQEAGSALAFQRIAIGPENRHSYSDVVKLKMDSKVGRTAYRIYALDSAGIYIGDGYKSFVVEIQSDYYYWANRSIYVPDTLAKTAKCYISSSTGEILSYTDGLTNSAKIDIGYFYDTTIKSISNGDTVLNGHTFYSLKQSPTIFAPYDLSSFTKNGTKLYCQNRPGQISSFQRMQTSALIKSVPGNNKIVASNPINSMAPTWLIYFLTESGKYGAVFINDIYRNNADNGTYMNIDIKVQK
nr:hypothetical protein [uncultured Pedobacter sp.]